MRIHWFRSRARSDKCPYTRSGRSRRSVHRPLRARLLYVHLVGALIVGQQRVADVRLLQIGEDVIGRPLAQGDPDETFEAGDDWILRLVKLGLVGVNEQCA